MFISGDERVRALRARMRDHADFAAGRTDFPIPVYNKLGQKITYREAGPLFGEAHRVVAYRVVAGRVGEAVHVSTIFSPFDLARMEMVVHGGPPALWETMIFGGPDELDYKRWRYFSEAEARAGHAAAVCLTRDTLGVTRRVDATRARRLRTQLIRRRRRAVRRDSRPGRAVLLHAGDFGLGVR